MIEHLLSLGEAKTLCLASASGTLPAALETMALQLGISTTQLAQCVVTAQAAPAVAGNTASYATSAASAITNLTSSGQLVLSTEVAASSSAGVAATTGGAGIVSAALTKVGTMVGLKGAAALAAGAVLTTVVLGGLTYLGANAAGWLAADSPTAELGHQQNVRREPPDTVGVIESGATSISWYVWYADNIGLKPVIVGSEQRYKATQYCNDYPGGGRKRREVKKVPLVSDAPSRAAAIEQALRQFTDVKRISASSTFVFTDWMGKLGGKRHDLDELKGG